MSSLIGGRFVHIVCDPDGRKAALRVVRSGATECLVRLAWAPNRPEPLDVCYDMAGAGRSEGAGFFHHGTLAERYYPGAITPRWCEGGISTTWRRRGIALRFSYVPRGPIGGGAWLGTDLFKADGGGGRHLHLTSNHNSPKLVLPKLPEPGWTQLGVRTGGCDIGFMLVDPTRATEVDFTPPFVRSDFTYLLPAGSSLRSAADVDRPGIRIAVVRGHASTAALVRIVKQASPVYAEAYDSAVNLVRTGSAHAFASIREMVLQYSAELPGSRVLQDSYQSNLAGIAVQKGHVGLLAYVSEFLDDMKRSGLLQREIDVAGLRGIEVVPVSLRK